jgi:hypothetical protein
LVTAAALLVAVIVPAVVADFEILLREVKLVLPTTFTVPFIVRFSATSTPPAVPMI